MIVFHVIGGLTGSISGALTLSAPKGGKLHRLSGLVFVGAVLLMSVSGAALAALMPERVSVIAGLLTFYLVVTGLLTVRRPGQAFRWMDAAASFFGLAVGITGFILGLSGSSEINGPPPMAFIFGVVAVLAVLGDLRMLLARSLSWTQRIARHLWRMCLALWIAAASFFLGQADEFPEALRIMPLLCAPVLLVMRLMFYWLVRVLFTQWRPGRPI